MTGHVSSGEAGGLLEGLTRKWQGASMAQPGRPTSLAWRKSKFSEAGNCIEVARGELGILVRDSKGSEHMVASISVSAWSRFIGLIKENDLKI